MAKKRFLEAISLAVREEMEKDEKVFVMGLDIRKGIMGITKGFLEDFGEKRVIDTPLSELGFTGLGVGAAMAGLRPVIEYQINTLHYLGMEQLVNQAAKLRYMTGGQVNIPLTVIVAGAGGGGGMAAQHSDNTYAQLVHLGMKVVVPSTPYDAKGLIKQAIREDDPVVVFDPARINTLRGEVPDEEYYIPLGVGDVKKEGTDVTIVAIGHLVRESLRVAKELEKEGISAEVVDPRTLFPLDKEIILNSVKKTSRLVVVDDGYRFCSFASEIASIVSEEGFEFLKAPIKRVTRAQVPAPYSKILENELIPKQENILDAVRSITSIVAKG
jgi:acetoin:2,6-dichlorophenolindophenol oxidoreductase subunit beta